MSIDPGLARFATTRQLEYLHAIERAGSIEVAAVQLGVVPLTLKRALQLLRQKAVTQGHSPEHDMTHTVPDGFTVRGVSTYYDEEGKVRGQWVKSSADDRARMRAVEQAIEALVQDVPRALPQPFTGHGLEQLATLYTLTDSHVGMAAWAEEAGADWNLQIAEDTLVGCFAAMVQASPDAHTGIIAQLGDFLHYDSAVAPVTPTHGHILDADGRMPQMATTAVRILRRVIDLALAKHCRVVIVLAEGNHDVTS